MSLPSAIRLPDDDNNEPPRRHLGFSGCFSCLPSFNSPIRLPDDDPKPSNIANYSPIIPPQQDQPDHAFHRLSAEPNRYLSRNPFGAQEQEPPSVKCLTVQDSTPNVVEAEEVFGEQELMDVPISTNRHAYDNEPDWTEMDQDLFNSEPSSPLAAPAAQLQFSDKGSARELSAVVPLPGVMFEQVDLSTSRQNAQIEALVDETPAKEAAPPLPLTEASLPISVPLKKQDEPLETHRSTVSSVAHSILGDKLEDLTEKLAYIRKNIIMKVEDDEDWDEPQDSPAISHSSPLGYPVTPSMSIQKNTQPRRPSYDPLTSFFSKSPDTTTSRSIDPEPSVPRPRLHRRSSSLLDEVGPTIARFMHQIGGEEGHSFSPSSFFAALAGPSPSEDTDREGDESKQAHGRPHMKSRPSDMAAHYPTLEEESGAEDDFEDLFDFSKVIEMGKNVRTFTDDVVDSGMRIINDVTSRIKHPEQHSDSQEDHNAWMLENESFI